MSTDCQTDDRLDSDGVSESVSSPDAETVRYFLAEYKQKIRDGAHPYNGRTGEIHVDNALNFTVENVQSEDFTFSEPVVMQLPRGPKIDIDMKRLDGTGLTTNFSITGHAARDLLDHGEPRLEF